MDRGSEDWIAIVERLLGGDRVAFLKLNRLVTGFLAQLRAYDFRDEWEDLRQEVLLSVVANARAGKLRDPRAFVGYVRIITRNKFVDRLKSQLRCREKDTLPWEDETARSGPTLTPEGLPEDVSTDLRTAMAALSAEQQRVVDGVYRQGKTYQQVADETGLPLGTMKRRLREALTVLRQRFAES
jgi:RNA polymerase sigma-70 factor (ECF subfamily)